MTYLWPLPSLLFALLGKTMSKEGILGFQARRSPVLGIHAAVSTSQPLVRRLT